MPTLPVQNPGFPRQSGSQKWWFLLSTLCFIAGAALAMSFLTSFWGRSAEGVFRVLLVGTICGLFWLGSFWRYVPTYGRRYVGWLCFLTTLGLYGIWGYIALAFGILLGWTVSVGVRVAVVAIAMLSLTTSLRLRRGFHIPPVLPLGIWIAAVLSGWLREEKLLRCDDYLALKPPVRVLVPSDPNLASCKPGEIRPTGRYPRTTWEAPDQQRFIFSTQGDSANEGVTGAFCESPAEGTDRPHCVGPRLNKSQGLIEIPDRNLLLGCQWGIPNPDGSIGSIIFEFPRNGPLQILAEHRFEEPFGDGVYEPRNSTVYLSSDRKNGTFPLHLPSFEFGPVIPFDVTGGEFRYSTELGEGVICGNGIGTAIRGAPFSARHFISGGDSIVKRLSSAVHRLTSGELPTIETVAESWGCDWDPATRKVYSTVPNLGLLDRIDYDTGQIEKRWFVGPGMRSVSYDRTRKRVYFTDFLRGAVLGLDEESGQVFARWFVGRFSRGVSLTRDGTALLASSNLGIVRIPLDETPQEQSSPQP